MTCHTVSATIVADSPSSLEACAKEIRDYVCKRLRCAGKAYWFIAASSSCSIEFGGEIFTPLEQSYMRRYEVPVKIVCSSPQDLVDTVSMILDRIDGCKGVVLSVKASR